ncbi:TPA: hypothetical protein ACPSEP_000320 [Haemophilus influenzae]|uniref:hypothetical protein n=2 Tax=Haemophilus influenzae TaxID=727 RepID=UPI000DD32BB9|nr:hypothetical protein [Haemophilus influenzae]MCK9032898.1 hypothetical protein [Haemophilus influenzae]RFO35699.1 hypothetical protein CH601_01625 [Haemophilus influenzae]
MKKLPNIYKHLFPLGNFQTIKEYFEYFIFTKNIDDLDNPLFNSSNRKLWLEDHPTLDCFPKTLSYIDDPNSFPLSEVAKELANVKLYLPKNEILFHSGSLPNKVSLAIGQEFKLLEIFSATLDPYIANVHDSGDDIYWYIQIKSENIRCLPISDEYGEYEVIILDSPIAKIVDIKTAQRDKMRLGDMASDPTTKTIIYVNLY